LKTPTISSFAPLLLDIDPERAEKLRKNLWKYMFLTPYLIPTVSPLDDSFSASTWFRALWTGAIGIPWNWMIHEGLKEQGFEYEAYLVRESSRKLVERGFFEFYDPITGEKGRFSAENFSFCGLVLDMY